MPTDEEIIAENIWRQRTAPEGFVRMTDGSLRPEGGNQDNGEDDD